MVLVRGLGFMIIAMIVLMVMKLSVDLPPMESQMGTGTILG